MECVDHLAWVVPQGVTREDAGELYRCTEFAMAIARDLLTATPRPAQPRPVVDLNRVVVPALQTLSHVMGERVRLRLRFSAEPALVTAEIAEIERIALNLALNARDAMAGEGVLTIATDVFGADESIVRLTVSGCGITPDVRALMFEPYFTTKSGGLGLGLTSVARTVAQLNGRILVDSEIRRGTAVSVLLPLARL